MPKALPDPNALYDEEETRGFFAILSQEALNKLVADGRFPQALQHTRETKPQWIGQALLDWMKVLPSLRRPQDRGPPEKPEKPEKKDPEK